MDTHMEKAISTNISSNSYVQGHKKTSLKKDIRLGHNAWRDQSKCADQWDVN